MNPIQVRLPLPSCFPAMEELPHAPSETNVGAKENNCLKCIFKL